MSWGSRLFGSGRWSPFNRSQSDQVVTEDDYSYITAADIARNEQTGTANRAPRDADIIVFRHNKTSYPVHFPGYSIDNGTLTVGAARQKAASEIGLEDARRVRMFYKGKTLKDDDKALKDEGFRSGKDADILVVLSDIPLQPPPQLDGDEDESDDEFAEADNSPSVPGKKKKRNKKGKKKSKRSNDASGTSTPLTPQSQPQIPATPQTPLAKLDALGSLFHTTFVPQCVQYQLSPPEDPAKRAFDHKRLTESILQQVLLKLDGVEVEGDPEARARRKELVKEVQGMLNSLDAVAQV